MRKHFNSVSLESNSDKWIGVDFDGVLSQYNGWVSATHLGYPIPFMVERVKKWIADGICVKVFTARVAEGFGTDIPLIRSLIEEWCLEHIGTKLEITNIKDWNMVELWDDRAIRVIPNTGMPCCSK